MMDIPNCLLGRRAALRALATLSAAIFLLAVLPAALSIYGHSGRNENRIALLARYRSEISRKAEYSNRLLALRRQGSASPTFLVSESPAQAQAKLQGDIKRIVTSNGGEVRSAFPLPVTTENGVERISIQYDLQVPATHLKDLTYAIETHVPYVFLDRISISAPRNIATKSGTPKAPMLQILWTVSGYRWGTGK